MKLKLNEKWSCGSNGHCKKLQKAAPIQNKTKPVNIYGKAKCLHNSGSPKCDLLMLCYKVSQKIKNLIENYFKPLKMLKLAISNVCFWDLKQYIW